MGFIYVSLAWGQICLYVEFFLPQSICAFPHSLPQFDLPLNLKKRVNSNNFMPFVQNNILVESISTNFNFASIKSYFGTYLLYDYISFIRLHFFRIKYGFKIWFIFPEIFPTPIYKLVPPISIFGTRSVGRHKSQRLTQWT